MTHQVKIYKRLQDLHMFLVYFPFFTEKFYQVNKNDVISFFQVSLMIS